MNRTTLYPGFTKDRNEVCCQLQKSSRSI